MQFQILYRNLIFMYRSEWYTQQHKGKSRTWELKFASIFENPNSKLLTPLKEELHYIAFI